MKRKTWCGLFSLTGVVGAGLVATGYLANKASTLCKQGAESFVNNFIDMDITLSGIKTALHLDKFPKITLHADIDKLQFKLGDALSNELVNSLNQLPAFVSEACKDVAWFQGAQFCLFTLAVGGVVLYAYNNFDNLKEQFNNNGYHLMGNNGDNKANEPDSEEDQHRIAVRL